MPTERSGRTSDIASTSPPHLAVDPAEERRPGVFILSDVRIYREGLAHSLSRHPGITVLDIADTSAAGLATAINRAPDAIILDIGTPGGFEVAKALSAQLPATKIVACALREVDEEVLACAEAGISGFVAADGGPAVPPRPRSGNRADRSAPAREPDPAGAAGARPSRAGHVEQGNCPRAPHRGRHGEEPRPQYPRETPGSSARRGRGAPARGPELERDKRPCRLPRKRLTMPSGG